MILSSFIHPHFTKEFAVNMYKNLEVSILFSLIITKITAVIIFIIGKITG